MLEEHRYSHLFPAMTEEEYHALLEDIRAHGQRQKVVLYEGKILDGRHRYQACQELGEECQTRLFGGDPIDGSDPLAFNISLNLKHRHLTSSQRACIAVDIEELLAVEAKERQIRTHANREKSLVSEKIQQQGDTNEGKAATQAAKIAGTNAHYVNDAKKIRPQDPILFEEVKTGLKKMSQANRELKEQARTTEPEGEEKGGNYILLDDWGRLSAAEQTQALAGQAGTGMNRQKTLNIEWALWSWNPITGCLHNCIYCYARDIAARFYLQGFVPTLHPSRLHAPAQTKVPAAAKNNIGEKNIFVCSMADLFGRWVPTEWIDAVLKVVAENPQWNFLFLTKFPIRLAEFDFPENAWVGTSVDCQARIPNVEKAFTKVQASVKWLSCEPLLEPLRFQRLDLFQWIVIGGASPSTKTPEWRPPRDWVMDLEEQARQAGCQIYEKDNLLRRIKKYPGMTESKRHTTPADFHYSLLVETEA